MRSALVLALSSAIFVSFFSANVYSAPAYTVIDVGVLGGYGGSEFGYSFATDINDDGWVTGHSTNSAGYFSTFLWKGSLLEEIGTSSLGEPNYSGFYGGARINDLGHVVFQSAQYRPMFWNGSAAVELGLSGGTVGAALGLNNLGTKVGWSAFTGNVSSGPTTWDANGSLSPLAATGAATDVNNAGQIIIDTNGIGAVLSGDQLQLVGTLGGSTSAPYAINDLGMVTGSAYTSDGFQHAFLWKNGSMKDLGTLGAAYSFGIGINNLGHVVGHAPVASSGVPIGYHGFLYDGKSISNLNELIDPSIGWVIIAASAINDAGQIAATGYGPAGPRALLLTPVPLPSAFPMLACALVGISLLKRGGAAARMSWRHSGK